MSLLSQNQTRSGRQEKIRIVSSVGPTSRDPSAATSPSRERQKALPDLPRNGISFGERWRRVWDRPLLNTWLAEICAISFSIACLVAIVVVLKVYERKSIPEIPFGLTLNAIISILATGSKSSLLLAVAGAIGQLKWCWFTEKKRPLEDLQDFDDASRGPWGSMSLLFTINVRSLASIGALVTVLTLAYDPFVQQVLKYPVRMIEHPSKDVFTGKARVFVPDSDQPAFGNALNAGIWAEEKAFARQPGCPSGDCNWAPFKSVGWCSKCENMTANVRLDDCPIHKFEDELIDELRCNLTLGYGSSVNFFRGGWQNVSLYEGAEYGMEHVYTLASQVSWVVNSSNSDRGMTVMGIDNPAVVLGFASLGYIGSFDDPKPNNPTVLRAEHCAITPCERTYQLSTKLGATTAEVTDINYGSSSMYDVPDVTFQRVLNQTQQEFCWQAEPGYLNWTYVSNGVGYFNWLPNEAGRWANMSHSGFCPLQDIQAKIAKALVGRAIVENYALLPGDGQPTYWEWMETHPYSVSPGGTRFLSPALQRITATNLTTVVNSVAASLTKLALDLSNETVHGSVSTSQIYVHAEWKWLIFPMALEALGIALLVLTIIVSHMQKTRLWKSSVMPLLYHGLDESLAKDTHVPQDIFGMEEAARKTKVALSGPGLDDRVVFAP